MDNYECRVVAAARTKAKDNAIDWTQYCILFDYYLYCYLKPKEPMFVARVA